MSYVDIGPVNIDYNANTKHCCMCKLIVSSHLITRHLLPSQSHHDALTIHPAARHLHHIHIWFGQFIAYVA